MKHYDKGQTVLNDWTAVRVTVGKEWVYGMTEREVYENTTHSSGLRFKDTPSCSTKTLSVTAQPKRKAWLSTVEGSITKRAVGCNITGS